MGELDWIESRESREPPPVKSFDESELARLRKAMEGAFRDMKQRKPHYYSVFHVVYSALFANQKGNVGLTFDDSGELVGVKPDLWYGFYADLARKLGVRSGTVRYRVDEGIKYFIKRAHFHLKQEEKKAEKHERRLKRSKAALRRESLAL